MVSKTVAKRTAAAAASRLWVCPPAPDATAHNPVGVFFGNFPGGLSDTSQAAPSVPPTPLSASSSTTATPPPTAKSGHAKASPPVAPGGAKRQLLRRLSDGATEEPVIKREKLEEKETPPAVGFALPVPSASSGTTPGTMKTKAELELSNPERSDSLQGLDTKARNAEFQAFKRAMTSPKAGKVDPQVKAAWQTAVQQPGRKACTELFEMF
jgi:hypothetical protein